MRLVPDQSGQIRRSASVAFTFDGEMVAGHTGESLAAALFRSGHLRLRNAPEDDGARGIFCCMGLCQECVVQIAGKSVEACRTPVSAGLEVTSRKVSR